MKREIICPACLKSKIEFFNVEENAIFIHPYPGEHVKIVRGTALGDFLCDSCGWKVPEGSRCAAVSIWADYGGIPYYEWEEEYIEADES